MTPQDYYYECFIGLGQSLIEDPKTTSEAMRKYLKESEAEVAQTNESSRPNRDSRIRDLLKAIEAADDVEAELDHLLPVLLAELGARAGIQIEHGGEGLEALKQMVSTDATRYSDIEPPSGLGFAHFQASADRAPLSKAEESMEVLPAKPKPKPLPPATTGIKGVPFKLSNRQILNNLYYTAPRACL